MRPAINIGDSANHMNESTGAIQPNAIHIYLSTNHIDVDG